MKTVEIVTHCWAGRYEHYALALRYQLASLVLHRPEKCAVIVSVCRSPDDELTEKVLNWFDVFTDLDLQVFDFFLPELGRRAIGRNQVAMASKADIVWFTDCDHVFGSGCLDALAELSWPSWAPMVFPSKIQIHRDHETGDRSLARAKVEDLPCVVSEEFEPKRYKRAIGGVQIVRGDYAREHGFLNSSRRWQQAYQGDRGFDSCRCDKAYRRFITDRGESIIPVGLPNLFRLRHTETTHHD
jgi:hypothetical protein